MFQEIWQLIQGMQSPVDPAKAVLALGFSLLASIVTYLLYQWFYGSRNVGAGVHRTFLIGGPAITALFLGIQVSIPLSLGLLGALSFVRFRTPVKDPAEIGFLLLLIASSIGAATNNFLVTGLLFLVVILCLGVNWLVRKRFSPFNRGQLMLSIERDAWPDIESSLRSYLKEKLGAIRLDTMSLMDDRVSLNYLYRRREGYDWAEFSSGLARLAGDRKIDMFIS